MSDYVYWLEKHRHAMRTLPAYAKGYAAARQFGGEYFAGKSEEETAKLSPTWFDGYGYGMREREEADICGEYTEDLSHL